MSTHGVNDRIVADAIDQYAADVYMVGFEAGEQHERAQQRKLALDVTPISHLVDELQAFRQWFNPNDSRYLKLGEIIHEFNVFLGVSAATEEPSP